MQGIKISQQLLYGFYGAMHSAISILVIHPTTNFLIVCVPPRDVFIQN